MIQGRLNEFAPAFGNYQVSSPEKMKATFSGVAIDSRVKQSNGIFVCIKGEVHDGHDFADDAVKNGASVLVVAKNRVGEFTELKHVTVIGVDDTLETLQHLAKFYLDIIDPKKVAVTGTNGKTTTKSLIFELLSSKYRTCATRGNFNNQFGVPLSIFEFDRDCEVAVFEFGMSTPGEIKRLVELYQPNIRVILNIGPAHLETMKTIDAVAEAKFEILTEPASTDWAVLNMDDPNIRSRSYRYKMNKITYGNSPEFDVHPDEVKMNGAGKAHLIYQGADITIPVLGMHQVSNCLAAISVAKLLDVPFADVKQRIESFAPSGNRMTAQEYNGITIINDSYNANPVSTKGALETIASMKIDGRKVLVFGDMLELGDKAADYHREVARKMAVSGFDFVVLLGAFAPMVAEEAVKAGLNESKILVAAGHNEAIDALGKFLQVGDLVLLKASRGIKLEVVEQGIKATMGRRN